MRQLILMRHAKSDWAQAGLADHDRPLNKRGRKASVRMGKHLSSEKLGTDVILASTALRVQETLELMLPHWDSQAEVLSEADLYLADASRVGRHIQALHDSWPRAMVVGHNPGLSAFLSFASSNHMEMPTAAVAVLTSPIDSWLGAAAAGVWELRALWLPRELDAEV
ncbi:MAG: histidine phosphatase family protein [Planctomycetales bacterium]|nr:histidine phosphatase family protein [Planctomycetales bacterium]